jgi:hypothetical protein
MVRAWVMEGDPSDPTLENHKSPPEFLTNDEVYALTGVEIFKVKIERKWKTLK